MKTFIIIFTAMSPHVDGRLLEVETHMSLAECNVWVAEQRMRYNEIDRLTSTLRCERRRTEAKIEETT